MKKINQQELLAEVCSFLKRMETIQSQPWGEDKRKARQALMDEIDHFDYALGPGLRIGRLIGWQAPGGTCAEYFVTGIGRAYVQLAWLPNGDEVESPVVVADRAMRAAVEEAIERRDFWTSMQDAIRARKAEKGIAAKETHNGFPS